MFFSAALRATFTYENLGVRVTVDGNVSYEGPAYLVAIANGRYFGGGMQIAPEASLNDGLFDVVTLGDYSKLGAISLSRAIYAGSHVTRAQTTVTRGRVVEIDALSPVPPSHAILEADGEVPPQRLPLQMTLHPQAISVCT